MTSLQLPRRIDPEAFARALDRAACEQSLYEFVKRAWPHIEGGQQLEDNWHVEAVCFHLEALAAGETVDGETYNRLLVNIPPGFAKSMLVSVLFPAWIWGPYGWPQARFICASHSMPIAERDTRRMKMLVTCEWYQRHWGDRVRMSADRRGKDAFENTETGWRVAISAGGITGHRADFVICLPYWSRILTEDGWLPIGKIVDERLDVKVAGTDGNSISYQQIEAWERNPARPLVRIDCGNGAILECTEDHLVYVTRRGWIPAREVHEGDAVFVAKDWLLRGVHEATDREKSEEVLLENVLYGVQKCGSKEGEHAAVQGVRGASVPLSSASLPQAVRLLLQSVFFDWRVQPCLARRQDTPFLSALWKRVSRASDKGTRVLFETLQSAFSMGCQWWAAGRKALRALRRVVQTTEPFDNMLFAGVRQPDACTTHEGERQRTLCPWGSGASVPPWMEQNIQSGDTQPGQPCMSAMPDATVLERRDASHPSHQLRQGRFAACQSHNAVQEVPREDAWEPGEQSGMVEAAVRAVERIDRKVEHTYNVRVAPHHNYFAEGVLVHNCDDPHSVDGANSDAERDSTVTWFREAVPTRLNDPRTSCIVVIMQRLHEYDVSGYILDKLPEYDHLMLPMLYDPDRAHATKLGFEDPRETADELLFPERFPQWVVDRDRRTLGEYAFAGQMQQSPVPRGGGIIKDADWILWDKPEFPPVDFIVASLDTAYTEKTSNDASALTIWGVFSGDHDKQATRILDRYGKPFPQPRQGGVEGMSKVILMYAFNERLEFNALIKRVAEVCKSMKVDRILVEGKASGISVAQELRRLYVNEMWAVHLINPGAQDKVARLTASQHLFSEGMVYAPDKAWAEMVIRQVASFPKGKHDDLCLVAGTKIVTQRGTLPIEYVCVGDKVLTPLGWKKVTAAAATGYEPVQSVWGVTGTGNHPVFTVDSGFVRLDRVTHANKHAGLTLCDLIRTIPLISSGLKACGTHEWVASAGTTSARTQPTQNERNQRDSTSRSGRVSTARRWAKGSKSITSMVTLLIAALKIWSAYQKIRIADYLSASTGQPWPRISSVSGLWHRLGTLLKKEKSGTEGTPTRAFTSQGTLDLPRNQKVYVPANSAASYSVTYLNVLGFVLQLAKSGLLRFDEASEARTAEFMKLSALGAGTSTQPSEETRSFAAKYAGTAIVYNLTVEGAHCFYANGVLVHNCDTVSQAMRHMREAGLLIRSDERLAELQSAMDYARVRTPEPLYSV